MKRESATDKGKKTDAKTLNRSVRKIRLRTAAIFAGVLFLAGFLTAKILPVGNFPVSFFRGSTNYYTNDVDERIRVLEAESEKKPFDANLWSQLGDLYADSSLFDKAISTYQRALAINPKNADVWAEIGMLHHRSGRPDNAIEALNTAIAADPKHESARFIKGIVLLYDLKDRDGALKSWEDLLEINPLAMASEDQSVDQLVRHYKEGHDKK